MAFVEGLFLLGTIAALVYFWCKYHYSYWQRKGVAQELPLPLVGNTKCMFTLSNSFGMYLNEVYNDPKYANEAAVGLYIMAKPALLIRDLDLVKSVLIKDFNKFSNRFGNADPHDDALGSNNLFFVRNPMWKEIRSKISPVFTSGKIKQMYPLMLEVGQELEKYLANKCQGKKEFEAEIKDLCANFTTDLIATVAYGIKANSLQNPNGEFRTSGKRIFTFTFSRSLHFLIVFFFPKLVSFFKAKVFDKKSSQFLRKTIHYVMKQREATGATRNDLIDILVSWKKQAEAESDPNHYSKNSDFLVAQAAVFFTAGFETSSSTMSFALYELARKPELQQRLRQEIHEALIEGNGTLSYEKIQSLEYLGMVVDETLRMYPVLPFLDRQYQHKQGEEPYSLEPFHKFELADGTPVFIPVYGLQHDSRYWPKPNEFNPERFAPEEKKNINPLAYIPFGTGPHNCIGMRVGLLQAKLGLVHILKNHYVRTTSNTVPEMTFEAKAFILQSARGIDLNVVNDNMYDKVAAKN